MHVRGSTEVAHRLQHRGVGTGCGAAGGPARRSIGVDGVVVACRQVGMMVAAGRLALWHSGSFMSVCRVG